MPEPFGMSLMNPWKTLPLLKQKMQEVHPRTPGMYRFPWGSFSFPSLGTFTAQFEEIYCRRVYEFVADNPAPRIVDCGGNMGMSTLWFKQNYPDSQITVAEPDPDLAAMIKTNLTTAGVTGWSCLQAAVSDRDGEMGFDRTGQDSGKLNASSEYRVRTVDIASLITDNTDLLKLDIEGGEFDVIQRLCGTGAINRIRCIACEIHLREDEEDRLMEVLLQFSHSGMNFFIEKANNTHYFGLNSQPSPFPCIGKNRSTLQVYAWRKNRAS